jgi:cell division protein FtsI (penicillin-binding protein 3)
MRLDPGDREEDGGRLRARLVAGALSLAFLAIVGRGAAVAFGGDHSSVAPTAIAATERRADILDRNGDLLATSLVAWSLSADPRAIWEGREVATALASVVPGLNVDDLSARLSDRSRRFVWVHRGLTPRQREAVLDLGLEGLRFEEEMKRIYPAGRLAGHLLGFTNVDGKGAEGVEFAFNDRLSKGGEPLQLTIDAGVQFALEAELDRASEDFDMKGAAGVVVEASTGAVRAIASWPSVDPNKPGQLSQDARLNRAMGAVYELGSIYKPLTVAAALEAGELRVSDTFDCVKPLKVGSATITDLHLIENARACTAADILAFSSNIGTAQIGARLGPEREKAFLERAGLLTRPSYEGPASAAPLPPADWSPLTVATVSYGHGIAVSPLAFAMTYTAFANGGQRTSPQFLEPVDTDKIKTVRLMSSDTAATMIDLLRGVVTRGTGKNAEADGFEVAGKTGTAEKPGPSGYDKDRNVTSFAAVFPASRPDFVVLIVLDEAQPRSGDNRTASYTAAAITGRFIARAAPLLDVQPIFAAQDAPPFTAHGAASENPAL